jgi:hypothetical protein
MDMDAVFREVARVLQPGGVFLFAEEPLLRTLSLRLYRCPYYETMKGWERKLYDWGLLGYLVRDVIGALQEESFGIRQNHTMHLPDWDALAGKYFAEREYDMFVPERGWGERIVKRAAFSQRRAAHWLGGTLAGVCRKSGQWPVAGGQWGEFEELLRCPDCKDSLTKDRDETLRCAACGYSAPCEGDVYNLLGSVERSELYPGDRDDIIDFSLPGHEKRLVGDWYALEGVHGNKFRWIGARAVARLRRVKPGPQRLRIRGHASPVGTPGEVRAIVNGAPLHNWKLDRHGLFVLEADLPDASEYLVELHASPVWSPPADGRALTVNLSMIRLVAA